MNGNGVRPAGARPEGDLRIHLLGGLEIEISGVRQSPQMGSRSRELLCFLAIHPGLHPRNELASRFWPDVLDQSARSSLRTALHGLRRGLGDGNGHLLASREGIGLDHHTWVDVREVAALADRSLPDEALALCHGDLVPGLDSDWVVHARDEHRELVRELHERIAADGEATGNLDAALRATREQVALDPLSEQANRRLMRRLAIAGDRPAALATFSRLQERLRSELGVSPSVATRRLVGQLRAGGIDDPGPFPDRHRDAARALDEALGAYVDAVGAVVAAVDGLQTGDAGDLLRELVSDPVAPLTSGARRGR